MEKNYLLSIAVCCLLLLGVLSSVASLKIRATNVALKDKLSIHQGIICTSSRTLRIRTHNGAKVIVKISRPVIVAQADQPEDWGFFQFPVLAQAIDGTLIVDWQMKEDSHTTYGLSTKRNHVPMISKDKGKSWMPQDRNYDFIGDSYKAILRDGNFLTVHTPKAAIVKRADSQMTPVATKGNKSFYRLDDLPDNLQGIYLEEWDVNLKLKKMFHAKLHDPGALRYAIDGMMPIVWWGNIKEMADGTLIAGTYPAYYLNNDGKVLPSGVSFNISKDKGHSWARIGIIPYTPNLDIDPVAPYNPDGSFVEPAFEILPDSTFLCVMRTGGVAPMYRSFSYDKGRSWTTPEPFTPNGVKPVLQKLRNGVLLLVSGRPGVQVRFNVDGTGQSWTEPIEMMPFMLGDKYDSDVSCGYAAVLEASDNSFYIAYSDFKRKNKRGEERKAIMFREITVTPVSNH